VAESWAFTVGVRLEQNGREVIREPVTELDLIEPLSESWLECMLRHGHSHVALEELEVRLEPIFSGSADKCTGYTIELREPGGHRGRREFTLLSLEEVASRAAQRLVARGELQETGLYYFNLFARRRTAGPATSHGGGEPFRGDARTRPLDPLSVRIGPLLDRSRSVGPMDDDVFPAFYTEAALVRAEDFARKGARSNPPLETGCMMAGPLCICPETREIFVVVLDVLEAAEAEQKEFSLFYSSRTWTRIQSVMKAMQAQPATRSYRVVGQGHGHNFMPGGGAAPCEACPKMSVCGRTSVFVSSDDVNWSRAVFRRQPWQLNHIFGLNARGEKVQGLFGLRDGRLLERGYRVIPEFDREGW
jgi:hypothetical protein